MNDNEKSVQKAMRIFEALSGVEEELLVECNKDDAKKNSVIPFWKYGKAIAACFCLVVAGALVWTASVNGGFRSVKTSDSAAALDIEMAADSYDMADAAQGVQENSVGAEEGAMQNDVGAVMEGAQETGGSVMEDILQEESTLEKEIEDAQSEMLEQDCSTALPPDDREKISELAAKKLDVYGVFVPNALPSGYVYESGSKLQNTVTGEETGVSLCWTKGMDSISWTVKKVEVTDVVCVDIANKECYDVHMYEIPYADTVPEKYRETFNNPVFKAEELSLELVESRMKVVQDAGDTDTPRGNFSVFYEEGILIEFRGDGTAEEIWNLFASLQR